MTTEIAYPQAVKTIVKAVLILSIVGFTIFLSIVGRLSGDAISAILFICALSTAVFIVYETKLRLDDEGIEMRNIVYRQFLKWSDIDDVVCLPQFLSVSSNKQHKKIRVDWKDFGLSPVAFGELQQIVKDRTNHLLLEKWQANVPPITFQYPGLRWGTASAYMVTLVLILLFFVLFVIKFEGPLAGKFLFLFLALLAVVPFLVRDYRRTRKQLIIENEGLRQTNGKEIFIPWRAVASVDVRKVTPLTLSIIVESNEGRAIMFPQSIMNCGQLLYWIKRSTNLREFIADD
jgi:hypothetical protein